MKKLTFILLSCMTMHLQLHAQVYEQQNISLLSNWNDTAIVAEPFYGIRYNGVWGWHDGAGHEYALIGATDGVHVIDVTNPSAATRVDFVPGRRSGCIWREIKTYQHYAYLISDDSPPNSFQIIDLQYLPDSVSLVYDSDSLFQRAHTLFVDGNKLYCGIVKGGITSGTSSMSVYSLNDPENPSFLRDLDTDYGSTFTNQQVHDMFVRNDTVYASAAFDGLFILHYDSVVNQFMMLGSLTSYPAQGYNHSSALTDDGHTLVFCDEVPTGLPVKVLDVQDMSNLTVTATFQSNPGPTPHNPFMVGNWCYIAYYQDGLQVYDVSDPVNPWRIGYFDTQFLTPQGGPYTGQSYSGAWGAYPYLPSGHVLVSDMQNGLYVLDISQMTGLQDQDGEASFSLFPNPVSGEELVSIRLYDQHLNTLKMLDATGRVVLTREINGASTLRLPIGDYSSGLYFLEVSGTKGRAVRKLMIK
ncbi:MAG: choice-of-anchor B family protein [Bacteroidia bacterium]